ncbi:MAG: antirestriction protein ArdA [Rhizobiaceae bacterium]|nr:antirestriction protein ArdA [Rhizobiaceae bacterium]
MSEQPRIYVACIASYNNGRLHGKWIDATTDVEEMQEEVSKVLASSKFPNVDAVQCQECERVVLYTDRIELPDCESCGGRNKEIRSAEEWAIHDYEGLSNIGEFSGLKAVAYQVAIIEAADDIGIPGEVASQYINDFGDGLDAEDIKSELENNFGGAFHRLDEWAMDQAEDMGYLGPDNNPLISYVDWESVARDWIMDYYTVECDGYTYIFYNH